jgi:HPt (histidine-containing phosphotransfer) domain-containing protein
MRDIDASGEVKVFDFEGAMDRLAGRVEYLERVVKRFLDDSPAQLVELARALDNRSFPEAQRIAHGFNGAAAMIGAARLGRQALALESALKAPHLDGLASLHRSLIAEFESFKSEIAAFAWPSP